MNQCSRHISRAFGYVQKRVPFIFSVFSKQFIFDSARVKKPGVLALFLVLQGCTQSAKLPAQASAPAVLQTTSEKCAPSAPTLTPQVLAELKRNAKDVGPLWRIEKDGRVSWLYGTIHVGPIELRIPGPNVMKAMNEVDVLGAEIVKPEDLFALQVKPSVNSGTQESKAPQVPDAQDPRDALVSQLLEKHFCLPIGTIGKYPDATAGAVGMLLSWYAKQKDGIFEQFGLDAVLKTIAAEMNKPVVALERPEDRLRYLGSLGLIPLNQDAALSNTPLMPSANVAAKPVSARIVRKGLRDITIVGDKQTKTFHLGFKISGGVGASYAALELAGLDAFLLEYRLSALRLQTIWAAMNSDDCKDAPYTLCDSKPQNAGQLKFLNDNLAREELMADEIARLHKGGQRVLGAVGAFHVRPQGLPAMMRAKGFTVEFVKHSK